MGVVYTNQGKAEAFVDSLELQCRLPQLPDEDEEFEAGTKKQKSPRNGPNPQHDTKKTPHWVLMALLNITNATLRLRHFPSRWKTANVILIPKPNKDPLFPSNYRSISLLPAMSKVTNTLPERDDGPATYVKAAHRGDGGAGEDHQGETPSLTQGWQHPQFKEQANAYQGTTSSAAHLRLHGVGTRGKKPSKDPSGS
ncbi:hypothetical protein NQ315_012469 [Exocentrus adspersus]|uniref:RNA-directed DNA polymerase from mobile element jockey n=1 Tax=Exocentrus adspersus TaxID=1586481 RepID=A0AAV8VNG3_9CUCU|nr:hypothetical protein NQ315_012469 [Exocentrus adspersus]